MFIPAARGWGLVSCHRWRLGFNSLLPLAAGVQFITAAGGWGLILEAATCR